MSTFKGEVLQRQGWWVKVFPTEFEAETFTIARMLADDETENPVRDSRVTQVPPRTAERWGTERDADVPCPKCKQPVASSMGIHFDCRE